MTVHTRPGRKALTPYQRFEKWIRQGTIVEDEGGCWIWMSSRSGGGYGTTVMSAKTIGDYTPSKRLRLYVHRWNYEYFIADIPEGLQLDHLCRVRECVNPYHLEPVTRSENIKRGVGVGSQWSSRTHCSAGHEYTPENTARDRRDNARVCRACRREYARRKRMRRYGRLEVAS